jgi:two-component system OmpR family response regulator
VARILLVDDDDTIRDLVEATLRFGVHEIDTAANPVDVAAAFARGTPDLVVLDLDLPDTSGLEILQRLRKGGARCRFVVLTGSGRAREPELLKAGASAYLTKPFSPLELIAAIDEVLARP